MKSIKFFQWKVFDDNFGSNSQPKKSKSHTKKVRVSWTVGCKYLIKNYTITSTTSTITSLTLYGIRYISQLSRRENTI